MHIHDSCAYCPIKLNKTFGTEEKICLHHKAHKGPFIILVTRCTKPLSQNLFICAYCIEWVGGMIGRDYLVKFCKLWQIIANSFEGTVSSSGSTVHVVRAAEPVGLRAAASWAGGLIRSTLPVLGHLHELGLLGNEGTVGSGGSTVHVVGAAEPVGLRAAASRARGLIRSTLTVIELHFHSMGKCHKGKDGH